jgi:hypothetical protein
LVKKGVNKTMFMAVMGVLRHVLSILGASVASKGWAEGSEIETGIGAFVTLVTIGWSVVKNMRAQKAVEKVTAMGVKPRY